MADYTEIDVNTLLPGEPLTSAIMLALEENPRAITEGATGAPGIDGRAIARDYGKNLPVVTVSAGEVLSQQGQGEALGATTTNSTTDVVGVRYTIKSYTGALRFKCSHQPTQNIGSGSVSTLSIYKNNSLVQSYTNNETDGPPVQRVNDISIAPGDVVEWRHRIFSLVGGQQSFLSGIAVSANNPYRSQSAYRLASEVLSL